MKKPNLQDKQDEKGRLWKAYRLKKREQWRELCTAEPRMIGFRKALRRSREPRQFIARLADSWLRDAPADVRFAALSLIDAHGDRMARLQGGAGLDDPLPPALNVFLASRDLLGVR